MNNDFENFQNIWMQVKSETGEVDKLISNLNQMERKSKRERALLIILFPLTIGVLMMLLPFTKSVYFMTSIGIIAIGMLMLIYLMYQSKIKINMTNESLDNKIFVDSMIINLHRKMRITSRYMWIYSVLLIIGINIGYLEAIKEMDLYIRIATHSILSAILLWFMYSAIKKKKIKNKREIWPLLEKLENLQKELANA